MRRVLDETGATLAEVHRSTRIPYKTLDHWMARRRKPDTSREASERLRALADCLAQIQRRAGVEPVTAAQVFEAAGRQVPGPLSAEREREIWERYRDLTAGNRAAVDTLIATLHKQQSS